MSKKKKKRIPVNKKVLQGKMKSKKQTMASKINKIARKISSIARSEQFDNLRSYMHANFLWCMQTIDINETCLIYLTSNNNKVFALFGTPDQVERVITGKDFVTKLEVSYDLTTDDEDGKLILVDSLKEIYGDDAKQVYIDIMMAVGYIGKTKCYYCHEENFINMATGPNNYIWAVCPECGNALGWDCENHTAVGDGVLSMDQLQQIIDSLYMPPEIEQLRKDMLKNMQS